MNDEQMEPESSKLMKLCPFCAEEIRLEAKKCKHCGEWMVASGSEKQSSKSSIGSSCKSALQSQQKVNEVGVLPTEVENQIIPIKGVEQESNVCPKSLLAWGMFYMGLSTFYFFMSLIALFIRSGSPQAPLIVMVLSTFVFHAGFCAKNGNFVGLVGIQCITWYLVGNTYFKRLEEQKSSGNFDLYALELTIFTLVFSWIIYKTLCTSTIFNYCSSGDELSLKKKKYRAVSFWMLTLFISGFYTISK